MHMTKRASMNWVWVPLMILGGLLVLKSIPDFIRYMKMESM
jgi:hypothetical protein